MGRNQSLRSTLAFAAVSTAVWVMVSMRWGDATIRESAIATPIFFALIFFTMRITNRLSGALARRVAKPPPPPPASSGERPAAPSSSSVRAEHAQRRRARRPRGGSRRR